MILNHAFLTDELVIFRAIEGESFFWVFAARRIFLLLLLATYTIPNIPAFTHIYILHRNVFSSNLWQSRLSSIFSELLIELLDLVLMFPFYIVLASNFD